MVYCCKTSFIIYSRIYKCLYPHYACRLLLFQCQLISVWVKVLDIYCSVMPEFLHFQSFSVSVMTVCYIHRHNKTWERAFVWCSIKQETSFYCLKQRLDALHQFFVSSFSSRSRRECHISPIAYTNKSSMQYCRICLLLPYIVTVLKHLKVAIEIVNQTVCGIFEFLS